MSYLLGHGDDILNFFKVFGIDAYDLYEATIHIKPSDIVTIETKAYLRIPNLNDLKSIIRKYRLELIDEKNDLPSGKLIFKPYFVMGDDFGRGI